MVLSNNKAYILGVDIGTSSSKALAFSVQGKVTAQHQIKYRIEHPRPGYSEQDPDKLLKAVVGVIRETVKQVGEQPLCVSFSSAMHSMMAVDKKGDPVSRLILWSDNRSMQAAAAFKQKEQALDFYRHTGTPVHPMSPFCKLLWWRQNEPSSFEAAERFISIKEYIFFRFFGRFQVDYSLASATGLFDHQTLQWYAPALDYAGIAQDKLSDPVPPTELLKGLTADYARQTGLDKNTPFVMGAGDGCLANLGTGVTQKGELAVTIGTSGAVRLFSDHPVTDDKGRIFNYLLMAGEYICGGAINNGGILLDWYRLHFLRKRPEALSYDDVIDEALRAEPGARGLLFLPYLLGERGPMWDARARGAFVGIANYHEKAHFARAIIEGICYSLYHNVAVLNKESGKHEDIYVSGGFTRSPEWVQLLTDLFGQEIKVSGHGDASSVGAAILGMKALGMINHWREVEKHIPITASYLPAQEKTAVYRRNFSLYARLYDMLCPAMHEIADWQETTPTVNSN